MPAFRQAEHVLDFFSISSRMFGQQNIVASLHFLLMPGSPKCRALSAAYLSDFGTMIRSSTMMMPQRWVSFFATVLYLGIILVALLSSRQQFNSISSNSAAVSLMSVCKSSIKSSSADLTLSSCCLFLLVFLLLRGLFLRSLRLSLRLGHRDVPGPVLRYKLRVRGLPPPLRRCLRWLVRHLYVSRSHGGFLRLVSFFAVFCLQSH